MNSVGVVLMLLVGSLSITAVQFDPDDDSDYIDDPDDRPELREPYSKFKPQTVPAGKVQGEIEKLLRQRVIQYEDPASSQHPGSSLDLNSGPGPTVSNMELYLLPLRNKGLSELGQRPARATTQEPTRSRTWTQKPTRSRRLMRTSEVVYSVYVPTAGQHLVQNKRPGVIESLVNAHDIVRYESTRRRVGGVVGVVGAGAYNEGGTRTRTRTSAVYTQHYQNSTARRYLVEPPAVLKTIATRMPRPTPTTQYMETTYKYTRRSRKHLNCTENYYDCLKLCFDRRGYRVRCKNDPLRSTTPPRINMSGLIAAAIEIPLHDYDTRKLIVRFKSWLLHKGYRTCVTWTTTTTTLPPVYPAYYDDMTSKNTGTIMAKCFVCGLLDYGIPRNANCEESFGSASFGTDLTEKNTYRRYCRWMDEVPLWFNRTDPFSVWGKWTGGCAYRYVDLSGLYTQRTCRSTLYPMVGHHYLSRRMATLELALKHDKDACIASPMATLVPLSRAISLYARFHVCVCSGSFCNRAARGRTLDTATILIALLCLCLSLHTSMFLGS